MLFMHISFLRPNEEGHLAKLLELIEKYDGSNPKDKGYLDRRYGFQITREHLPTEFHSNKEGIQAS